MQVTAYLNLNFDDDVPFVERVDRAAAAGVDGIEFYGWDIPVGDREAVEDAFYGPDVDVAAVAERIHANGLDFVYLSGDRPPLTDPEQADAALESIERSLDLAVEHGCLNVNVKSGATQPGLDDETQRGAVIDTLREAAPLAEDAGVTLLLEPLNHRDAPEHFLHSSHDAYGIIEAVDSPAVRLLYDCYHEQIVTGDLITNVREHLDLIGHVHIADVPTQNEPGTGEINVPNVLAALDDAGYDGYVGCEFIPTGDPAAALEDVLAMVP